MNWSLLHIAIVGPLPPPAGGMAGQTRQLAELLEREGATVRIVQSNMPYWPSWIARLRGIRAATRLVAFAASLWRVAGDVQILHVMANSGWSWHLFAAPAIWIGRLRGVRVLVNYRGGEAEAFLTGSLRWIRPSLRAASVVAVPSGFLEQVFGQFGFGVRIVPNIVDVARFHPRTPGVARETGTASTSSIPVASTVQKNVLVARNLESIYDNATALRAFVLVVAEFPQARLVIAGSGPEEAGLKQLARELGIASAVEFPGKLDRDQIALRYREADVMLNPSRVDNMPNSILESMASGVPVVSTDVGGVPFIVSHEATALLVPAGDAKAMANAILRLFRDEGLAARLAANGVAEVQRYTWPYVRQVLGEVYQTLLVGPVAETRPA